MTKHRRRDNKSVAKSHRNKIVGTGPFRAPQDAPGRSSGSSRGELSTAMPREAKPPEILDSGARFAVIRTRLSEYGYPPAQEFDRSELWHFSQTVIHAL